MSSIKTLLSPTKSGSYFAPFRTRSANPDGFDCKMKIWISAIEELSVESKKLQITLDDIHSKLVSSSGSRPDKECLRLVLSEMKRKSLIAPYKTLKTSKLWRTSPNDDPKGWLDWGLKKIISLAQNSTLSDFETYSDATDLSITNEMPFVCFASLNYMSESLYSELKKISKAEKQSCFELDQLLPLINPMLNTIIEADNNEQVTLMLDLVLEYLSINNKIGLKIDGDTKLVKVPRSDEYNDDVTITQKDVALARLLKAKETLTNDLDRYLKQAQNSKEESTIAFQENEIIKAKSLLRSNKRFTSLAEQKEAQIRNVEELIDKLEETDSHKIVIDAYKESSIALAMANMSINESRQDITLPLTTTTTPTKTSNTSITATPAKIYPELVESS